MIPCYYIDLDLDRFRKKVNDAIKKEVETGKEFGQTRSQRRYANAQYIAEKMLNTASHQRGKHVTTVTCYLRHTRFPKIKNR